MHNFFLKLFIFLLIILWINVLSIGVIILCLGFCDSLFHVRVTSKYWFADDF